MRRRYLLSLLAGTALVLGPATALAADTAEATGIEVEGVLTIGKSESTDGDGSATGLSILGQDVVQSDEGEESLLSSQDLMIPAEALELDVAKAEADGEDNDAETALVDLSVGDGALNVGVVTTEANSDGSARTSLVDLGTSEDDPEISVGETELEEGEVTTELVELAGTPVGSSDDTGGQFCPLDVNPLAVADILCVDAASDDDPTLGGGVVPFLGLIDDTLVGDISSVEAGPSDDEPDTPGAPDPGDDGDDDGDDDVDGDDPDVAPAPDPVGPGTLSGTGASVLAGLLFGLGSAGAGAGLLRRGRRRG